MNKCACVFFVSAMILSVGCSGQRTEHEGRSISASPQGDSERLVEDPAGVESQIECDKFELVANVIGSTLALSVDTDLPDTAIVMVSVSRSYWEKGNTAEYSVDYFSEKSTVRDWKSEQRIPIDNEYWVSALSAKQKEMSRAGLGFDVASIRDTVTVRMVVPINQPDPTFGDRNGNLVGKAVRTKGLRIVEDQIEIVYPLSTPPVGASEFAKSAFDLEVGQAYVLSRQTPLMPTHDPGDPVSALQQRKMIPEGGSFRLLGVVEKLTTNPWYKVRAFAPSTEEIGIGWINSTALIGQELKLHR